MSEKGIGAACSLCNRYVKSASHKCPHGIACTLAGINPRCRACRDRRQRNALASVLDSLVMYPSAAELAPDKITITANGQRRIADVEAGAQAVIDQIFSWGRTARRSPPGCPPAQWYFDLAKELDDKFGGGR